MVIAPEHLIGALLVLAAGVGTMAWWFVRRLDTRVDQERQERERAVKSVATDINNVGTKLQAHELKVATEYVNHAHFGDRLAAALKPIEDGFGRMERALERIFEKLDGKMDKPGGQG